MTYLEGKRRILLDPATPYWAAELIYKSERMDVVDVLDVLEILVRLFQMKKHELLAGTNN